MDKIVEFIKLNEKEKILNWGQIIKLNIRF